MRGIIGLVSILVVVFIIVYIFSDYMKGTKPAMNQLAGRSSAGIGQSGTPVLQDSKFAPVEKNGRLVGLTVVAMPTTNGLYEYFGLIPGDVIREIGPFKAGDDTMSDFETSREWVQEGMQRQMKMVVERGGQRITLPDQRSFVPPPAQSTGSQNQ
jgi:hypothetical protein